METLESLTTEFEKNNHINQFLKLSKGCRRLARERRIES